MESNEEWLEEDLCKMSYKELKKIAVKKNINSKMRKAQLMSALLTTGAVAVRVGVDSHSHAHVPVAVTGRVTRSRAALRPLNTMDERTCPKSEAGGLNILSRMDDSDEVTKQRQSRKKKTTIIDNCCEEVVPSSKESLEGCGKSTATATDTNISGVGNEEETLEELQNCSSNVLKQKESSETIDEAENIPASNLPRISTFVLDEQASSHIKNETEIIPVTTPLPRSSTFLLNDQESSGTISEGGNMPMPTLLRSSTFVLDDQESSGTVSEGGNMPVPTLLRSSTFVLDDQESSGTVSEEVNVPMPSGTLLRSSTFVLDDQDVDVNAISKTVLKENKIIGGSIRSSKKISEGKKIQSSLGRKKNATGSILKNYSGVTRKAPNFKAIHKRLFDNMESLSDNQDRKLARAASYMHSPTPQCAILSPRLGPMRNEPKVNSSLKTGIPIKIRGPASVQSTAKVKTPPGNPSSNNTTQSSSVLGRKRAKMHNMSSKLPPGNVSNIVNSTSTSNLRFSRGQSSYDLDRKRERTTISTKLPPVNVERRDEDRAYIQGVRMNKRFLLQMEMRKKNQ